MHETHDTLTYRKHVYIAAVLILLLTCVSAVHPCSQFVPGGHATRLSRLSGQVQATRVPRDYKAGQRPVLAGARVELRVRTDKAFVQPPSPNEPKYRADIIRSYVGAIKEYECGKLVSSTATNRKGKFQLPRADAGKYCFIVIPRERLNRSLQKRIYKHQFAVDVVAGAAERFMADVSPLNSDCSGGGEIVPLR